MVSLAFALLAAALGAVSGVVVDASWAPVPGAQVKLVSASGVIHEARTNRSGVFELAGLPREEYELTVFAPGFKTTRQQVSLSTAETVRLGRVLLNVGSLGQCVCREWIRPPLSFEAAKDPSVSGTVARGNRSERGHRLLPGATVEVAGRSAVTDAQGHFSISGLPSGAYRLRVSAEGHADFVIDALEVKALHTTVIGRELELRPCGWGHCEAAKDVQDWKPCNCDR